MQTMAGHFFVNKTPSSEALSKSSRSESAVMLSHVQTNRRRAEGRDQHEPWSAYVSVLESNERSPSPSRPVPSFNAYDPFHCTVIGTEAETHTLLRRAFFEVARTNFLAEAFAPNPQRIVQHSSSPPRHQAIISARLQRCVHDKLLMYATLAYSSSMLGWITGRFSEEAPEVFIGKAIPHLRSRVHIAPDDWLLLSLYSLAITELWNGLPEMWARHDERRSRMVREMAGHSLTACRMHLRALVLLVTNAGGWHLFNPYLLDSTLLADKFLAIASEKPPILGLAWDPGPGELNTALTSPLLGERLLNTVADTGLGATLRDLVEYCHLAQEIWRSDHVAAEAETWLFRRLQAIQMRLLLHFHDQALRHNDRCTSLAALVFVAVVIPSPGTKISAQYLAHSLCLTMQEIGRAHV